MSRTIVTQALTKAARGWLIKNRMSVYQELGPVVGSRCRLDLLALSCRHRLIGIEVKSCISDFTGDKKWEKYFQYCNQLYFIFSSDVWKEHGKKLKKLTKNAGILVLETNGYARVKKRAKWNHIDDSEKLMILAKIAWSGGISCANSRRTKVFLETS